MTVTILLADDHQIMREGLRALLEKDPKMQVEAEAADGHHAVELSRKLAPHVVIMDISMPGLNGIEATRQIAHDVPAAKVIALSMHSDRRFVAQILRAGAAGYLLKDCASNELISAIQTVLGGKVYLSPAIAGAVVDGYVRNPAANGAAAGALTPREREVLQLMAEGHSTKQIAARLKVSPKTIETHRRRTMIKLDLHSIAELTKYAIREGLTSSEG